MQRSNAFLSEVIPAFGEADGVIPLRRVDAYVLYREAGYTAQEADWRAFAGYIPAMGGEPWPIEAARDELVRMGVLKIGQ